LHASAADNRVWERLSLHESTKLVKQLHKRKHGKSVSDSRAKEVASLFAQGHEYFKSAADAGELVRPLILYYGAMALARGSVLFLDRSTTPGGTHGLKEEQWQDLNAQPRALPNFELTITSKGTFPALCKVSGNSEMHWIRATGTPNMIPALYQGTAVAQGTQLTIKEVLAQIPDVAEMYESTFEEFSHCLRGDVQAHNPFEEEDGSANIAVFATSQGIPDRKWVSQELNPSDIASRPIEDYHHFAEDRETRTVQHFWFGMPYKRAHEREPNVDTALGLPVTVGRRSGNVFLKLGSSNGIALATLPALYLIAYATGMLVRYHPGYWMSILSRTSGDLMAPILSAANSLVEELLPRLLLEKLEGVLQRGISALLAVVGVGCRRPCSPTLGGHHEPTALPVRPLRPRVGDPPTVALLGRKARSSTEVAAEARGGCRLLPAKERMFVADAA
jgi:hypothetical protein